MAELITTDADNGAKPLARARAPYHVLVKPIGALCNLDCEYCFYLDKAALFRGSKFRMTDAVLETHVRDYIGSQPDGARDVEFAWQGGEPTLLGVDFFRRAVALQEKYRRPGMRISNALQTNGTKLDREWCEFLREHEFLVGISIDGPVAFHDRYRKTKGGKGSFRQVRQGLENLRKYGVQFNVLTVLQRHNADHPEEVYEGLKQLGAEHIQFIPIVERAGAAGVSERSVRPEQYGRFMIEVFERWRARDIGRVFVQQFESALNSVVGNGASVCVHARRCGRALALEHNGNLYSCDHFVDGDYLVGNITQSGFTELVDGAQQSAFGEDKEKRLTGRCRRCDVLDLCNGGCPAQQFMPLPNEEFLHNYLCEGYKAFFRHVRPILAAMGAALRGGQPAHQYHRFLPGSQGSVGRNDPCPCGSGRKFKHCCA